MTTPNFAVGEIDVAMTKLFTVLAGIYDIQSRDRLSSAQIDLCKTLEVKIQQAWTHLSDAKDFLGQGEADQSS